MQVTGFRAVSRPGDVQSLVRWERYWELAKDGWEVHRLRPMIWEWTYLDVSNPRRIEYDGPSYKWTCTAIYEATMPRPPWPREAPSETEYVRRDRIMVLRQACHVDPEKGEAEPRWMEPAAESVKPGAHPVFLEVRSAAA